MTTSTPTPNTATTTRPERSSRRAARKSPLGWLPWALLGLLALLLAATFLLINALDDDGLAGAAGDTLGQASSGGSGLDGEDGNGKLAGAEGDAETSTGGDAGAAAGQDAEAGQDAQAGEGTAAGQAGQAASLTANGEDLLGAAGGSLADRAGQPVTGTATVESVVSDEGFWVGSSPQERVFVFLTPQARQSQGESGFQVEAGQTVQLSGTLTALAEAPDAVEGVTAEEGRSQIDQQGGFVLAESVTLA